MIRQTAGNARMLVEIPIIKVSLMIYGHHKLQDLFAINIVLETYSLHANAVVYPQNQ